VASAGDSLGRQLGESLATLRRVTSRAVRRRVAPAAIAPAAVVLLVHVVETPGGRVAEAAEALALAPNTVSTLVTTLLRAGLIERDIDAADRRVAVLRPSRRGRARVEQWRTQRQRVVDEALDALDPADRQAIEAAVAPLRRLSDVLSAR
jgi:DNA-binding MarR family transcriptional regulator